MLKARAEAPSDQYGLSPLQEGMLFHHLLGEHSGVDIQQIVIDLNEPLDVAAMQRAWQQAVDRHAVLRTSFLSEGLAEPLQRVHQAVRISVERHDPGGADSYLQTDRRRGFDLREAPLMRLALFHFGGERYRMVWSFHHILMDGRGYRIVLPEVFRFYDALCRGEALVLPDPQPFRDYVEWIRSQDLSAGTEFWKGKLKGFTAPTPLLVDRSADPNKQDSFGEADLQLPLETSGRLRAFARSEGLTLNTLIQGAWALLLSRYSGEEDVVFGATKTTRRSTVPGAESIVGLFLATIPVRSRVAPDRPVRDWLKELRAEWVSLRDYEHTPLVAIRKASDVAGGAPLFETLVVFENQRLDNALRDQIGEFPRRVFQMLGQTNYALALAAYDDPEILLNLGYDSRRFGEQTIRRMLGHVRTLLEGMVAHPEGRVADVPLVTEGEREQLLSGRNDSKAEYPRHLCLHEWFEAQVDRTPDNVAVVFEDSSLTYRELNARANQLAHYLRRLGVGAETLVGLRTERSLEMVVGLIGILKAGGAYLPVDTVYPKDRVAFMLDDAEVRVLLTQEPLLASLAESRVRVVCLDTEWESIAQESTDNLPSTAGPDSLAYVIYTSGSTGKPKGCLVTHYNVVRLMQATDCWFHFHDVDVWTLFHSHAFDFSVWEIWGALLYGGRLVVVPYWVSRSPQLFHQLLHEQRVTVLNQTPSAFRQLIQADEAAGDADLALRLVIFGGEALELESLRPWFERHGDRRPQLVNMYGITETTVHVTCRPLSFEDVQKGRGSVIGGPIPDVRLYILDAQLQPAPIGVPGEICVGGAGVARGYLNRSELTRERFIDDPFSTQSGARLYRSGDLARRLANGDVEYLGRIDQQVKIRGFRVELGEIEAALRQHPAVKQAVVVAREGTPGDKRLAAYLVPSGDAVLDRGELRALLKQTLPNYMIPADYVVIAAIPISPNGKIDRNALPRPVRSQELNQPEDSFCAPRTPMEERLAEMWRELLKLDRIGTRDNFFELGGNSLLAVQLAVRTRSTFGVELRLARFFDSPTIESLACLISELSAQRQNPEELLRLLEEIEAMPELDSQS
jgi:amino acid adenylation domain-containing protein